MNSQVVEELPLYRAKCRSTANLETTTGGIGPGSYDVDMLDSHAPGNASRAPFNTTAVRFPLPQSEPRVPGPERYDAREPESVKIGVASCPFVSTAPRFPLSAAGEAPGPGAYSVHDNWSNKPKSRTYRFSELPLQTGGASASDGVGPGRYNPNYGAAHRANPKAAHFGKYSGREGPITNANPGPGSYDADKKIQSSFNNKPSSMFATKTGRDKAITKDTPGPGHYDISSEMGQRKNALSSSHAGFGSSAKRFAAPQRGDVVPGPGSYTGEIAPRRAAPLLAASAFPFASTADRFASDGNTYPGPGSYDGVRPSKHSGFGAETPFGSTAPRFKGRLRQPAMPFDQAFDPTETEHHRAKPRPGRAFIVGDIHPATGPERFPERNYDVNYNWPKPVCTRSTFGAAARSPSQGTEGNSDAPGPGAYFPDLSASRTARGNSNWGKDVRFHTGNDSGTVGPGRYHHESTLLKKSFNCTIGSDALW